MQVHSLPKKFNDVILQDNNSGEMLEIKKKLDDIFFKNMDEVNLYLKGNVRVYKHLPNYVVKSRRKDAFERSPDQHIYGVRRGLRMQKIIEREGFRHCVTPKQYLYLHNGEWYVVAEYLDLIQGTLVLNQEEAEELTTLCFKGKLVDVHKDNVCRMKEGKIALVDTEAVERGLTKSLGVYKFDCRIAQAFKNSMRLVCSFESGIQIEQGARVATIQSIKKIRFEEIVNYLSSNIRSILWNACTIVGLPVAKTKIWFTTIIVWQYISERNELDEYAVSAK